MNAAGIQVVAGISDQGRGGESGEGDRGRFLDTSAGDPLAARIRRRICGCGCRRGPVLGQHGSPACRAQGRWRETGAPRHLSKSTGATIEG